MSLHIELTFLFKRPALIPSKRARPKNLFESAFLDGSVFKIYGARHIKPPGPAAALGQQDIGDPQVNPIVKSVRQWSPALLFQYYFNAPTAKFRPFVRIGVSYNGFSDVELSQNFVQSTHHATKPGCPLHRVSRLCG